MPSKDEEDGNNSKEATIDHNISRDVENLVSEIKEKLRLSGLKVRQQKRPRPSPYFTSRTRLDDLSSCTKSSQCNDCSKNNSTSCDHNKLDDPYEMLQELLRDKSLIKEAVRRLQSGLTPKERYFYDSDEESTRSPLRLVEV